MSLTYVANTLIPNTKANSIQILNMCQAFASNGQKVTLIIPHRSSTDASIATIEKNYGLIPNFDIKTVPVVDFNSITWFKFNTSIISYYLTNLTFVFSAFVKTYSTTDIVYSRSKLFALVRTLFNLPIVFEAHDSPHTHFLNRILAKKASLVVTITKSMNLAWRQLGAKTLLAPTAVSDIFFASLTKKDARTSLNLHINQKIAMYAGSLSVSKGVDAIIAAAKKTPHITYFLIGTNLDAKIKALLKTKPANIVCFGFKSPPEIHTFLKAADVLLLPGNSKNLKNNQDTSPMKLFEYFAAKRPVVAAATDSNQELISNLSAHIYNPADIGDLIKKIESAIQNPHQKTMNAFIIANKHTWNQRAKLILENLI